MHILILEDEIPAFEKLRSYLSAYFKEGFSYDWGRSLSEAFHFLDTEVKYAMIISDIQLLDGVSFEVFEKVTIDTPIIFCSAFDEYLFKAFQSNGIAYILKPYGKEEIEQALAKYEMLFKSKNKPIIKPHIFSDLHHALDQKSIGYKKRFVIKSKKGIHLLETNTISLIKAEGDFCRLKDISGSTHLYSQNLGAIYSKLDPAFFFRINRSEVVQLAHIERIENHFKNRLLITLKGVKEPVKTSSSVTAVFREWIDK